MIRVQRRLAPAYMYRLIDADGVLLYVGMTGGQPLRRLQGHKRKTWWPDVAQIELEPYATEQLAHAAEIIAIQFGRPLHNVRHHPDVIHPSTGLGVHGLRGRSVAEVAATRSDTSAKFGGAS